ncbi:hypothetical protein T265_11276 [Opisthorchis viverrini]|uniref:Uncharacterized protein n=1 Tax=Opisthorchis viverrini TaxID=6198 RepID=A0A074ZA40_OPIVI|nr:hypothetical protein T265_11276 [Opisthorchis viverrini]KER20105.1 hypothetical protein T265_11276 [Opisthorchis viverrini]
MGTTVPGRRRCKTWLPTDISGDLVVSFHPDCLKVTTDHITFKINKDGVPWTNGGHIEGFNEPHQK